MEGKGGVDDRPLLDSKGIAESQLIIKPSLPKRLVGEAIGTGLLVAFGTGCIMSNTYLFNNPVEVIA